MGQKILCLGRWGGRLSYALWDVSSAPGFYPQDASSTSSTPGMTIKNVYELPNIPWRVKSTPLSATIKGFLMDAFIYYSNPPPSPWQFYLKSLTWNLQRNKEDIETYVSHIAWIWTIMNYIIRKKHLGTFIEVFYVDVYMVVSFWSTRFLSVPLIRDVFFLSVVIVVIIVPSMTINLKVCIFSLP